MIANLLTSLTISFIFTFPVWKLFSWMADRDSVILEKKMNAWGYDGDMIEVKGKRGYKGEPLREVDGSEWTFVIRKFPLSYYILVLLALTVLLYLLLPFLEKL